MNKCFLFFIALVITNTVFSQSGTTTNTIQTTKEWKLVWQDEFNYIGLPDPSKWDYEDGFIRNNEKQFYTVKRKENVFVKEGFLTITGRKETYINPHYEELKRKNVELEYPSRYADLPDSLIPSWIKSKYAPYAQYTSGSITTKNKASWKYGRFEVRAKLPQGSGIWPALWMLGVDENKLKWPKCGEIDIMEFIGITPGTIYGTVHYADTLTKMHQHKQGKEKVLNLHDDFHIYATEWDSTQIVIFVDDKAYLKFPLSNTGSTEENAFRQPFYFLINLALGGSWPGPIDDSILPQSFMIDYVRVYQ